MSQSLAIRGVGRLHFGHRTLGCVGYAVETAPGGTAKIVKLDPMPDATEGDVFTLTLEDGRVLECQLINEYATYFAVLDGPRCERRHHRRPAPAVRAYL